MIFFPRNHDYPQEAFRRGRKHGKISTKGGQTSKIYVYIYHKWEKLENK